MSLCVIVHITYLGFLSADPSLTCVSVQHNFPIAGELNVTEVKRPTMGPCGCRPGMPGRTPSKPGGPGGPGGYPPSGRRRRSSQ